MVTIDGSQHSGSGAIVRYSVVLAALLHQPVRVINVRRNRAQRGLRTQHVASVLTCAALCGASGGRVCADSSGSQMPDSAAAFGVTLRELEPAARQRLAASRQERCDGVCRDAGEPRRTSRHSSG